MTDRLIGFYNQELADLRRSAAGFAAANPVQAGHLRLGPDAVEDPHVARLMEAFAYLTARLRLKLEDDFPELTDALLGILYPHYLAPLPSVSIVQFTGLPDPSKPVVLPAGTELDSEPADGEPCRFRTCYPVPLWPIVLEKAQLGSRPIAAPANPRARDAVAVLHLSFRCALPEASFSELGPDSLRLFLRGAPEQAFPLYDLLAGHVVSVAVAESVDDPDPAILPGDSVRPVGFAAEEAVLPPDPRTAPGYRLLTEYFAWPEKFLFFDLTGLAARAGRAGNRLDVFLYLDRAVQGLDRGIGAASFALGCTPVVNLFHQRAEPIPLTHRQYEYRVVPDARRPRGAEVYAIESVAASVPGGARLPYLPFYGSGHHGIRPGERGRFWQAVRRPADPANPGSEVYLSLVDLDFDPNVPADHTLSVELTCLNRNAPARLPFGGGHPYLTPVRGAAAVKSITCLTAPTRTLRPAASAQSRWRLISHLSLNHLSLLDGAEGVRHLRELLKLYDLRDTPETGGVIEGVAGISARPGAARAPQPGPSALCRGVEIELDLAMQRFSGTSSLLFAGVLERFFALHATVNAFTRLTLRDAETGRILKRWPARAGERILL
jgi:type VI secretion system protein ImpG